MNPCRPNTVGVVFDGLFKEKLSKLSILVDGDLHQFTQHMNQDKIPMYGKCIKIKMMIF